MKKSLYAFLDSLDPDTTVVINGIPMDIGMIFGSVDDTFNYTVEYDEEFVLISTRG